METYSVICQEKNWYLIWIPDEKFENVQKQQQIIHNLLQEMGKKKKREKHSGLSLVNMFIFGCSKQQD